MFLRRTGIPVAGRSVSSGAGAGGESALARLTADQREAVVLKVYQGFKFEEIAPIQSCPVSTVKSRLYTAFELLRNVLAPVA